MINEQNGTLVAATVATVTFANRDSGKVKVFNRDATAEIWYTDDGTTPTVAGTNCYFVAPNTSQESVPEIGEANTGYTINLISSATPKYTVEVLPSNLNE